MIDSEGNPNPFPAHQRRYLNIVHNKWRRYTGDDCKKPIRLYNWSSKSYTLLANQLLNQLRSEMQ